MRNLLAILFLVLAGCGEVKSLADAGDESPDAPGGDAAETSDGNSSTDARIDGPPGGAVCNNGIVEPGETCDGNCPVCPMEIDGCARAVGSAATCNLVCHQPVRTCGGGDNCCAFDGAGGCGASSDAECAGPSWQAMTWPRPANYTTVGQCDVIEVHGIVSGGAYVFTTCSPSGMMGTGDPLVTSVVDGDGTPYQVTNDDCGDMTALPRLAGWQCTNNTGQPFHFCASASPGGFRVSGSSGILRITVCPYSNPQGASGAGSAPFSIWYNAPTAPYSP